MCQVSDSSSGFSGEALSDKAGQRQSWGEKTSGQSLRRIAGRDKGTATAWPCGWRQNPQLENSSQLKLTSLSGLFLALGHSQVDAGGECVSSTDRGKKNCT